MTTESNTGLSSKEMTDYLAFLALWVEGHEFSNTCIYSGRFVRGHHSTGVCTAEGCY